MNSDEVRLELKSKKPDGRKNGFHMMATKAFHLMGNLSRDEFDLCFIYSETNDFFVGSWVCGFGFFDVLFPKETTRELTADEIEKYNGQNMAISNTPIGKLNIVVRKSK